MLADQFRLAREKVVQAYSPTATFNADGVKCKGTDSKAVRWDIRGACDYAGPKVYDSFKQLLQRMTFSRSHAKSKKAVLLLLDAMIALSEYQNTPSHDEGVETSKRIELPRARRNARKWHRRIGENHELEAGADESPW